jgi:thymidylate synthase
MAYFIEEKYIGEAWISCLKIIDKKGRYVLDSKGKIKETLNLFIGINRPWIKDRIIKKFIDKKLIGWMKGNFLKKDSIPDFEYSYGQRLFNYNKINQLNWVIKHLRKNVHSKSATITLMKPGFDSKHVPCLTTMDFKIRNEKLLIFSFLRSQDIFKKMCLDVLAIAEIQKMVAKALQVKIGPLYFFVVSAHIYKEDYNDFKKVMSFFRTKKP